MTIAPRRAAIDQGAFLFPWGEALIYPPRSDVVIDCGLFHRFSDADRIRCERSLHRTLRAARRYVLLCSNDFQPCELGPRRVTQAEIRATFATGWTEDSIVAERITAQLLGDGAHAWLASLTRI